MFSMFTGNNVAQGIMNIMNIMLTQKNELIGSFLGSLCRNQEHNQHDQEPREVDKIIHFC